VPHAEAKENGNTPALVPLLEHRPHVPTVELPTTCMSAICTEFAAQPVAALPVSPVLTENA
jgi:hypothetical protein